MRGAADAASLALVVEVGTDGTWPEADQLETCLTSVSSQTGADSVDVLVVHAEPVPETLAPAMAGAASFATLVAASGAAAHRSRILDAVNAPYVTFLAAADRLPPGSLAQRLSDLRRFRSAKSGEPLDVVVGRTETFPTTTALPPADDAVAHELTDLDDRTPHLADADLGSRTFRTDHLREVLAGTALGATNRSLAADRALAVAGFARAGRAATSLEIVHLRRGPRFTELAHHDPLRDPSEYALQRTAVELAVEALGPIAGRSIAVRAVLSMTRMHVEFAPLAFADDEAALRSWFGMVRDALAAVGADAERIDVADVIGSTQRNAHRAAFAAVLADDFVFFRDRDSMNSRVTIGFLAGTGEDEDKEDQLFLDVPVPERLRPLLAIARLRAVVERVRYDAERKVVVFDGRAWVPGASIARPLENTLYLRVGGNLATVPVTPTWRPGRVIATGEWTGFVAEVPVSMLRSGTRTVRVSVTANGLTQEVRARASAGFMRSARLMRDESFGMLPSSDRKGRALLTQYSGKRLRTRLRWRARILALDVKQVVRLRPFATVRIVRLVTLPFFRKRRIWLVGERFDTAQDNGLHLYRHLRGELDRPDVHYLIRKDSAHVELVEPFGNVVWHGGLRHRLYMLHAEVLVNSQDIDAYMLPPRWDRLTYLRNMAWRVGSRRVFLQHGIIYNDVGAILQPSVTGLDVFVSGAEREGEYIREITGYTSQVQSTGLPRYDALQPTPPSRTILFMPTWRRYLVSPSYAPTRAVSEPFEGSVYEQFMRAFLTSPALHEALERNGFHLEFLAHYEIVDYVRHIDATSPHITITHPGARDVQSAIKHCDVMVTDWSSVFFDAAYLGTPLIHVPFDEKDFRLHYREGWFDPDRDGFGPVARTPEQVVEHLAAYMANGCVREDVYDARADAFFTHHDRNNAARVTAVIDDLLG